MMCKECNKRMRCFDTANYKGQTARRYKCVECGKKLYTLEVEYDLSKVNYILSTKCRKTIV